MFDLRYINFAARDAEVTRSAELMYQLALDYLERNQVPYNPSFRGETLSVWDKDLFIHFTLDSEKYLVRFISLLKEGITWDVFYSPWQRITSVKIEGMSIHLEPHEGITTEFIYSDNIRRRVIESNGNKSGAYLHINLKMEKYDFVFFQDDISNRFTFWELYDRSDIKYRKFLLSNWLPFIENPL